jgi:hypothetical protein
MNQTTQKSTKSMRISRLISRFALRRFGFAYARLIMSGLLLLSSTILLAEESSQQTTLSSEPATGHSWRFRVWLDDKEIGYHNFFLAKNGEMTQLHSEASFEYKLLFVKLYDYKHENRETWNGDCLQSIDSRTDANGQPYTVNGRRKDGEFELGSSSGETSLPECVMSFAYWNPSFLQQKRLLNTQNGEFLEIQVSPPVFEELEVQGEQRPSNRYRLAAGALNLDLWYSMDKQWLALESETEGGRKLRYELL